MGGRSSARHTWRAPGLCISLVPDTTSPQISRERRSPLGFPRRRWASRHVVGYDCLIPVECSFFSPDPLSSGVSGFFAGLPEGTLLNTGLNSFRISYTADVGRDVTVTVVPEPSETLLMAVGLAALHLVRPRRSRFSR